MSENLPAKPKAPPPPVVAGGQVAALIPQSLDEAFRVANAIALSGLAPRGMDKPEQVLVAIMAGAELGLAPFQSIQSFAVVNNRPTLWGDGLLAVVRSQGVRVREWMEGAGDSMVAFCEATRPDTGETVQRDYSVADAKKAGLWGKQGPWQQHPKRMLQMRARSFALRDGCADMLRGIQIREEVQDYEPIRNVTPQPSGLAARLAAGKATATEGFTAATAEHVIHDAETGEIVETQDAHFADNAAALAGDRSGHTSDGKPLKPCGACGAAEGAECADACSSWDELDPSSWPDSVRAHREANRPTFDVVAWATKLERDLPDYAGVDVLRGDWNEYKDELKAKDPELWRRVNMAIAKRAEEIAKANAEAAANA